MPKMTIGDKNLTVSEMRRKLARALAKIDGGLMVTSFSFSLTVVQPKREFPKGD